MTGTVFKVLMAASALVPVAASAQRLGADVDVSVDARADRGDRWQGREQRGDRPQPDVRPQERASQRPDVAASVQARGDDDRRRYRDDRGGDRPQYSGERGDDRRNVGDRPGFQGDRRDGGSQFDRDRRDGRQDYRPDRQAYQGGRRDDDRRFQNGQQYRGYGTIQGGYRGGYDNRGGGRLGSNRGQWNRGWRSDNRYAWSDYRASNRGAYRLPRYYAPSGWGSGYRRFGIGFTLSSVLFNRNYWIQDPYTYRLPEAYGPYRWVRYYNDALLVDLDSGRVVDTVYDIFW